MQIIRFDESYMSSFQDFVNDTYGPDYFLNDIEYIRWWFKDSPFNPDPHQYCSFIALHDDRVVGFQGQIPVEFYLRGLIQRGTFYCNLMVRPEYRGRALGLRLVGETMKHAPNNVMIGSNDLWFSMMKLFKINTFNGRTLKRCILVIHPDIAGPMNLHQLEFQKKWQNAEPVHCDEPVIRWQKSVDAESDLWEKVAWRYSIATHKSSQYIRWRYLDHPRIDYHVLCNSANSDSSGVCVVRFEDLERFTIARIVDLWGTENGIKGLLPNVIKYLVDRSVSLVDFMCTQTSDKEAFDLCGFQWLDHPESVPYLFKPLTMRDRWFENVGIHLPALKDYDKVDFEDLYFVKGDSDRDR